MLTPETKIQLADLQKKGLVESAVTYITRWLESTELQPFHKEIMGLIERGDVMALNDAFFKPIPFGTAGIRGVMGVGANRINIRTISQAAQGYVNYLKKYHSADALAERGMVITYDVRHHSKEFAEAAAGVFAQNGCKVYFYSGVRSTPQISFSIRNLGAVGGAMISASHNPPADNGIKLYWENGGQLVPPHDGKVIAEGEAVTQVTTINFEEALQAKKIIMLDESIDEDYQEAVSKQSLGENRDVHIVFTPLHGCASTSLLPVLRRAGFKYIDEVRGQMPFDPDFKGVTKQIPNPEIPESLDKAILQAKQSNADIVLAADPDADRIAVVSKAAPGSEEYIFLNGNQIGVLLLDYITRQRKVAGTLPIGGVVIKTIVTSELISQIATENGLSLIGDVPVGIKYIADAIDNRLNGKPFVFAAEESHGYVCGTYGREKDSASAGLLISEFAALLKSQGKTLAQELDVIKKKYGYYREIQQSLYFTGMDGMHKMLKIMDVLRNNLPTEIGGQPVYSVLDQQNKKIIDPQNGKLLGEYIGFPDNALIFYLTPNKNTRVVVRPSGTEPKIKFYVAVGELVGEDKTDSEYKGIQKSVNDVAFKLVASLVAFAETISAGGKKSDILG